MKVTTDYGPYALLKRSSADYQKIRPFLWTLSSIAYGICLTPTIQPLHVFMKVREEEEVIGMLRLLALAREATFFTSDSAQVAEVRGSFLERGVITTKKPSEFMAESGTQVASLLLAFSMSDVTILGQLKKVYESYLSFCIVIEADGSPEQRIRFHEFMGSLPLIPIKISDSIYLCLK